MKMSFLSQFDVICIIPLWIGNNEISLINLSLTVMFVVLIGIDFNKLLYNLLIPRNFQNMYILNFSISNINLGGGKYFNKLTKIQVLKLKKNVKVNFHDSDSIYNPLQYHPFIPNIIFTNNKFFIKFSNFTTKKKNAFFLVTDKKLYNNSNIFLFKNSKIIYLDNKLKINNIILQLKQSEENQNLSNAFTNDLNLNSILTSYLDDQVKNQITQDDYSYFEKNSDILDSLHEVKKIID